MSINWPESNLPDEAQEWRRKVEEIASGVAREGQIFRTNNKASSQERNALRRAVNNANLDLQDQRDQLADGARTPSAPADPIASSDAYFDEYGYPRATVFASSAPVTLDTNGEAINVSRYELFGRPNVAGESWVHIAEELRTIGTPQLRATGLPAGMEWAFKTRAVSDRGSLGEFSAEVVLMLAKDTTPPPKPAPLTGTSRLGQNILSWSGLTAGGGSQPADFSHGEVGIATTATGAGTIVGRIAGSKDTFAAPEVPYNAERWYYVIAVDFAGNRSAPSDRIPLTTKPLVDTDVIGRVLDGANIKLESIQGELIAANALTEDKLAVNVRGKIDKAVTDVAAAQAAADQAKADASAAGTAAAQAKADATAAGTAAANASTAAGNALTAAQNADGKATTAGSAAAQAAADALAAKGAADTAKTTADTANAAALSAAGIANSKGKVLTQTATPAVADRNDATLWIDITGGANTPKRWNGNAWVAVTDKAATDAATAAANAATAAATADGKAVAAQTAANNAAQAASAAQGTANTAVTNAATAQSRADNAKTAADTAQAQADTAKLAADAALKGSVNLIRTPPPAVVNGWFLQPDGTLRRIAGGGGGLTFTEVDVVPGQVIRAAVSWSSSDPTNTILIGLIRYLNGAWTNDGSGPWIGPVYGTEQGERTTDYTVAAGVTKLRFSAYSNKVTATDPVFLKSWSMQNVTEVLAAQATATAAATAAANAKTAADAAAAAAAAAQTAAGNAQTTANQAQEAASGKSKTYRALTVPSGVGTALEDTWEQWSSLGTGGKLLAFWRWGGAGPGWVKGTLDETYLPLVNIGSGTYGLMKGDRLEANSVTTSRLTVSDLTNLIDDPGFDSPYGASWAGTAWEIASTNGAPGRALTTAANGTNRRVDNSNYFSVKQGDEFFFSFRCQNSTNGNLVAYLAWRSETKAQVAVQTVVVPPGSSWADYSRSVIAPEGAFFGQAYVLLAAAATTGSAWFSKPRVFRRAAGEMIVDGAISADKIAADAVTAAKILAGSVTAVKIAADAVTADKILANAVTAVKIAADAVTADKILANAVTAGKVAANAITAREIVAGTITATEIATDAITSVKILANSITTAKIAANAVTANEILANTITGDKLVINAITAREIAALSVAAGAIQANAVTADKILAGAVTTVKLDALAVTAAKIAANAITADKIDANAVTAEKISATAIDGKTITGALIRSSAGGARTEMNGSGLRVVNAANQDLVQVGYGIATGLGVRNPLTGAIVPLAPHVFGTVAGAKTNAISFAPTNSWSAYVDEFISPTPVSTPTGRLAVHWAVGSNLWSAFNFQAELVIDLMHGNTNTSAYTRIVNSEDMGGSAAGFAVVDVPAGADRWLRMSFRAWGSSPGNSLTLYRRSMMATPI